MSQGLQMYSYWLELSIGVRHQIAHKLGIEKKFPTEVQDNKIKTDGYLMKDIEVALSVVNLQKFLGTGETDHALLLKWLIEGKPETFKGFDTLRTPENMPDTDKVKFIPNKKGRPSKIK